MMESDDKSYIIPMFLQGKKASRYEKTLLKLTHYLERFLESLVQWRNYPLKIQFFYLGSAVIFTLISFVWSIPEYDGNDRSQTYKLFAIKSIPLYIMQLCCLNLSRKPRHLLEYRRHFTDIRCKKSIIGCNVSIVLYSIIAVCSGFTKSDIFAIIGLMLIQVLSILVAFIHAQRASKLRIKPCASNDYYTPLRSRTKDKGSVRILESTVFKVTLKNIGTKTWNSTNSVLHRHTCWRHGSSGTCFRIPLPDFTILPEQQVDLVPEGHEFEGECIRVPFHCFGKRDRENLVKTIIFEAKKKSDFEEEEEKEKIGKFCCGKKEAEHFTSYKFNHKRPKRVRKRKERDPEEWTNNVAL